MNRYDFTQPGGFPFDQGVMQFIQDCIKTASQSAALGGQFAILSGCTINGNSVGNGWVVINGETLPFIGGALDEKVVITENASAVVFQDGAPKIVKYERAATFGNDGVTNYLWSQFKRNTSEGVLARLERLEWLAAPDLVAGGGMRLWRKPANTIPAGWREVIDWRGRLPLGNKPGVDGFEVGQAGGSETHQNSIEEMAPHTHGYTDDAPAIATDFGSGATRDSFTGNQSKQRVTQSAGLGQAYSILNPYRIVIFIEPIPGYIV